MIWQRRMAGNRWLVGGNDIHPGEGRAVLTAGLLFFLLLTCLMVLRPAREALGLARGVEGVRRLFLVTVVCDVAVGATLRLAGFSLFATSVGGVVVADVRVDSPGLLRRADVVAGGSAESGGRELLRIPFGV